MVDWIAGASIVGSVYGSTALLHVALPFPSPTIGYACDCNGKPLTYKLNGIYVMLSILGLWILMCSRGILQADYMYEHIADAALVAFILGISGSLALYLFTENEPYSRCSTRDRPVPPKATSRDWQILQTRSQFAHFFLGRAFNPRLYSFDLKMYGYTVGAIMLLLKSTPFGGWQLVQCGLGLLDLHDLFLCRISPLGRTSFVYVRFVCRKIGL
jgi:hypothetical protein